MILGGGIAGLSAGWRWSRAGFQDYKLLELESQVGGNSRALEYAPTAAPIGAHYLPLPNTEARAVRRLLSEMGILRKEAGRLVLADEHLCHSRQERVFFQGAWYDGLLPEKALGQADLEALERFREHIAGWTSKRDRHGRKVFALPLHHSSREPEFLALDKISFAAYAQRQGWTQAPLRWLLEYACRDDFGGSAQTCSAWAGLHYFASRDGGGLGNEEQNLVWPEGNQRLVKFLAMQGQGEVRSQALVTGVSEQPNGELRVSYWDAASQNLRALQAKVVVCCLPDFLRPHIAGLGAIGDGFVYPPWVTANLLLSRTPYDREGPGRIAWDNIVYDSPSLGYVVATHQHLTTGPNRPTVWTWYRPFPDSDPVRCRKELLESSWEEWSAAVLSDLKAVHYDIEECCERVDITVLGHGMVRPSVDFIWSESLRIARQPRGRIFFGHGDLSGMSLFEESQFRGVLAAEQALSSLGVKTDSFL